MFRTRIRLVGPFAAALCILSWALHTPSHAISGFRAAARADAIIDVVRSARLAPGDTIVIRVEGGALSGGQFAALRANVKARAPHGANIIIRREGSSAPFDLAVGASTFQDATTWSGNGGRVYEAAIQLNTGRTSSVRAFTGRRIEDFNRRIRSPIGVHPPAPVPLPQRGFRLYDVQGLDNVPYQLDIPHGSPLNDLTISDRRNHEEWRSTAARAA